MNRMKLVNIVSRLPAILLSILLCSAGTLAHAQSITIPAQTVVTPIAINGTTVQISIIIPAQTVPLPAGTGSLPSGLTWSGGVLAVAGSVQATTLALTGGPTLPACVSNLYFLAPASSGSTTLQPSCYVVPTLAIPPITVASSGPNTITLTP
jgi:hypothetical protein